MNYTDLRSCPHCGGTSGLFTRFMSGYYSYYRFGEDEPYESEQSGRARGATVFYCMDCERPVIGADGKPR